MRTQHIGVSDQSLMSGSGSDFFLSPDPDRQKIRIYEEEKNALKVFVKIFSPFLAKKRNIRENIEHKLKT